MDIQQILNNYLEVAKELGNDSAAKLIEEFASANNFCITNIYKRLKKSIIYKEMADL